MRLHLIFLMFFVLLSGCAQRLPVSGEPVKGWQTRLSAHDNWQAEGKIAFISPDERQSANLSWQHGQNTQTLRLTSFIGTQILKMKQTPNLAELDYDGEHYVDSRVERLMERLTGLQLPIDEAGSWLKGLPKDPGAQVDTNGRVTEANWVAANGDTWRIRYLSYVNQNGYWVPNKLRLSRSDLSIKINLSNWQFNP